MKKEYLMYTYKQQKNEITKLIRKSKELHYNDYFVKNSTNVKKLWAGINQIVNQRKNSSSTPVCIEIDNDWNVTITDLKEIANAFNLHYTTISEKF